MERTRSERSARSTRPSKGHTRQVTDRTQTEPRRIDGPHAYMNAHGNAYMNAYEN
ncbi:hypothetical protein ACFWBB_05815 [Streptomyces sp. NPDC060000]|uniref:hypothetical protein n=1 Tax=Streptomyces sp. NPDC060000 TaxID=3347031 RepID=UPI0036B346D7